MEARNSYHGNLPLALERDKIGRLTDAVAKAFGHSPTVFKAGRYGLGPNTLATIADFGYTTDCSVVPYSSYARDGGPVFYGLPDQPYWTSHDILEVPLARGFIGLLPSLGERWPFLFDSARTRRLKLPGLLSRLGIVERSTLTPEGVLTDEQIRLVRSLIGRGKRVFTLTYHSSSLGIGCSPYVRNEEQRDAFLAALEDTLVWLRQSACCEFTTVSAIRQSATV